MISREELLATHDRHAEVEHDGVGEVLDRFLMRLSLGYPSREEEREIARRFHDTSPLADLTPTLAADELTVF